MLGLTMPKKTKPVKGSKTRARITVGTMGALRVLDASRLRSGTEAFVLSGETTFVLHPSAQQVNDVTVVAATQDRRTIPRSWEIKPPQVESSEEFLAARVRSAVEHGAEIHAALAIGLAAVKLVERLAVEWVAEGRGCDEPGSAKEAFELLVKHEYTLNSTRTLLYRPDGSEVVR